METVSQNIELISPIIQAMEGLGIGRLELAGAVGISLTTVEYTEKCMYVSIPERILELLEVFDDDLPRKYRLYQVRRRQTSGLPRALPDGFPLCSDVMHPHREWRELVCELPVNVYCEMLCVPRFPIQKLERGIQHGLPRVLSDALFLACGGPVTSLLSEAVEDWHA